MPLTTDFERPAPIRQLARMMIKQARVLKKAGLMTDAKALARRAIAMNHAGHAIGRLLQVKRIGVSSEPQSR